MLLWRHKPRVTLVVAFALSIDSAHADLSLPKPHVDPTTAVQVFQVRQIPDEPIVYLEHFGNEAPLPGSRYAAVDQKGVFAWLEATGRRNTGDCYDDCPTVSVEARILRQTRTSVGPLIPVAIGPLPRAPKRARAIYRRGLDVEALERGEWVVLFGIDLDGDGNPEVEQRMRYCNLPSHEECRETRSRVNGAWVVQEQHRFRSVFEK
jgi:hypothetical protein